MHMFSLRFVVLEHAETLNQLAIRRLSVSCSIGATLINTGKRS